MGVKTEFLKEVDAFRDKHVMSITAFGTQAMRDPSFLFRLTEEDKRLTDLTIDTVRDYMAKYEKAAAAKAAAGEK